MQLIWLSGFRFMQRAVSHSQEGFRMCNMFLMFIRCRHLRDFFSRLIKIELNHKHSWRRQIKPSGASCLNRGVKTIVLRQFDHFVTSSNGWQTHTEKERKVVKISILISSSPSWRISSHKNIKLINFYCERSVYVLAFVSALTKKQAEM